MKNFLAVLMLSFPGHILLADDPAETWMAGYLYLQEGLAADKAWDKADAITLLVRSLGCYRILASEHELFEPHRRNERILLIADILESLGGDQFASFLPFPGSHGDREEWDVATSTAVAAELVSDDERDRHARGRSAHRDR